MVRVDASKREGWVTVGGGVRGRARVDLCPKHAKAIVDGAVRSVRHELREDNDGRRHDLAPSSRSAPTQQQGAAQVDVQGHVRRRARVS